MRKKLLIVMLLLLSISTNVFAFETKMLQSTFGCSDEAQLDKILGYIRDKDNEAYANGLLAGILAGKCTLFDSGEAVFVTDIKVFSGLKKVRKIGRTTEFWVISEMVNKK